jgi:hypothetical protein
MSIPPEIEEVELLAWVGEDELGSGVTGLKQVMTPKGLSALVACKPAEWIQRERIAEQLQRQSNTYGKTIYLCRYEVVEVVKIVAPSQGED